MLYCPKRRVLIKVLIVIRPWQMRTECVILTVNHRHKRSEFIKLRLPKSNWSRVSSGSIVSDYGLDDRGSIPGGDRGFFL
jgi:hypothetical protein